MNYLLWKDFKENKSNSMHPSALKTLKTVRLLKLPLEITVDMRMLLKILPIVK